MCVCVGVCVCAFFSHLATNNNRWQCPRTVCCKHICLVESLFSFFVDTVETESNRNTGHIDDSMNVWIRCCCYSLQIFNCSPKKKRVWFSTQRKHCTTFLFALPFLNCTQSEMAKVKINQIIIQYDDRKMKSTKLNCKKKTVAMKMCFNINWHGKERKRELSARANLNWRKTKSFQKWTSETEKKQS